MRRVAAIAALLSVPVVTTPAVRAADRTLRLATLPVDGSVGVYYAADLGLFKDAGLDVQIQPNGNGAAVAAAVAAGALDLGWSNVISLAVAYKRGIPFTIVAGGGVYERGHPTSALLVTKNSPLRVARDLDGKTLACNGLTNMGQYAPQNWMDKNGGNSATPHFVEFPFPEMAAALAQGRCDAAFIGEPFITQSKDELRVFAAPLDLLGARSMLGGYFSTQGWVKQNHDLLAAFVAALDKAHEWANAHHDDSAAILAKYSHTDVGLLRSMRRLLYVTRPDPAAMQGQIDITARYGGLAAPFDANELITRG